MIRVRNLTVGQRLFRKTNAMFSGGEYGTVFGDDRGILFVRLDSGKELRLTKPELWEEVAPRISLEATQLKLNVKYKKLHPDAVAPTYAKPGDAGFDFYAIHDAIIEPGESVTIDTGLAFAVPQNYELQARPRSGVSANTKIRVANSPGTIDSGYRGEVSIIIDNIAQRRYELNMVGGRIELETWSHSELDTLDGEGREIRHPEYPIGTIYIHKGDRIAQGVFNEVPQGAFEEVDNLDETERGTGGFGSTGVK